METMSNTRQHGEAAIENWDDDEDFQDLDGLQIRNASGTTVGSSYPNHRDSISSRMSIRSDKDSAAPGDEDWQVLVTPDGESSKADAINSAKSAGIPIPQNVPVSALMGGTIKRLGGRTVKKVLMDDWGDDLEMPKPQEGGLVLKKKEESDLQESMRQFSAEFPSSPDPAKATKPLSFADRMASAMKTSPAHSALEDFKEDDDDDFGDVPTIKIAKNRSPQKPLTFLSPTIKTLPGFPKDLDDMENELEFPDDGKPLRLSTHREPPKTPLSQQADDIDIDWAEGSLGTRFGGTARGARSNPSSSVSAFSPSASSRLTGGESEDEGLDDLILPDGPFKFDEALKKRIESASHDTPDTQPTKRIEKPAMSDATVGRDDFFTGIDIGDGDVFDSGKLTLNRNIKQKVNRQMSPVRRTAMTLTFTHKIEPGISKIPRPQPLDRGRYNLEPVSESGGPIPVSRRPGSRMTGHSSQHSLSAIPAPPTPSASNAAVPSTPSRKGLSTSASRETLKAQPITTSSQYLKSKRSMPVLNRHAPSPARAPSRGGDYSSRPGLSSRPKTPVERSGTDAYQSRKPPLPFLPAGTPHSHSHHITTRSSRNFNRPNSSDSNENATFNRPLSRLSNFHRPTTPPSRRDHAPEALAREAAGKRTMTKPARRRAFGDGHELEIFDDLPTSASHESKFLKQPVARGAPKSVQMRSRLGLQQQNNQSTTSLSEHSGHSHTPAVPSSPIKKEAVPRFARDTNASRLAREQRIGSVSATLHNTRSLPTVREAGGPLSSISTNFNKNGPPPSSKHLASPMPHSKSRSKHKPPQKPRLIKPMNEGAANSTKTLKGMSWNPVLFRWEGNENALAPFDVPAPGPGLTTPRSPVASKAPALIANVGATKGVQISGGMVFDPVRMRWLKLAPQTGHTRGSDSNPLSPETIEDEDDPFAGLDDLDDGPAKSIHRSNSIHQDGNSVVIDGVANPVHGTVSPRKKTSFEEEEAPIQEEFDVGPEFIRRQRAEEERWRNKVAGWVGDGIQRDEGSYRRGWKWAIREKVMV